MVIELETKPSLKDFVKLYGHTILINNYLKALFTTLRLKL
jgi:hypothetical protein|nr:MAG TPA: hypothetical protein [Bacteriophage sp.]